MEENLLICWSNQKKEQRQTVHKRRKIKIPRIGRPARTCNGLLHRNAREEKKEKVIIINALKGVR
ncbi:MAG TPA: hypothetical protein VFS97_02310 [Nitrososphaeraceae archaeon]|nr:hypothetical protein [Nitrososphaeraceae archaeon]